MRAPLRSPLPSLTLGAGLLLCVLAVVLAPLDWLRIQRRR